MAALRKDGPMTAGKPTHVTTLRVQAQQPTMRNKVPATATTTTTVPETPLPDYDEDEPVSTEQRRSSAKFVNNFRHIISNIRTIEDLYSNLPEPDPDYLNDDDDDTSAANNNIPRHHRHQKQKGPMNGSGSHSQHASHDSDFPPPPPPLTAEELASAVSEAYETQVANGVSPTAPEEEGGSGGGPQQIKPKPLHNPCVESKERQALHRELLLNYKIGKDVLQKPELNKVLRERRETQRKKEWDQQKAPSNRTSLEFKLKERRTKEEEEAKMKVIEEDESTTPELLRIHKKIMHKSSSGESS